MRRAREQWRIRQQVRRAQAAQNGQSDPNIASEAVNIIPSDENPNENVKCFII